LLGRGEWVMTSSEGAGNALRQATLLGVGKGEKINADSIVKNLRRETKGGDGCGEGNAGS